MIQLIGKIYDNRRADSWATQLRQRRFALLNSLISSLPKPIKILDVGGKSKFWENMGFLSQDTPDIEITLLNMSFAEIGTLHPRLNHVIGDAREMKQFEDQEFDIVFSNSVIEHVGDLTDQAKMADEVKRVGKRYFIQTPNFYFPIEPHFVFPCFHWLPVRLRVWLVMHFALGWFGQFQNEQDAILAVKSIQLLRKQDFVKLFSDAVLYEEKVLGLTKSLIVRQGWTLDESVQRSGGQSPD